MSNNNAVDNSKVQKMQAILKDNFQDTMEAFLNDAETYIDEIERQIDSSDLSKAKEVAHKLKSSAGLFGLVNVNKLSEKIEREANNSNEMQELLSQLKVCFAEGKETLKKLE